MQTRQLAVFNMFEMYEHKINKRTLQKYYILDSDKNNLRFLYLIVYFTREGLLPQSFCKLLSSVYFKSEVFLS